VAEVAATAVSAAAELAPRVNPHLVGHADAERVLLQAWTSGRLPHAWLLTGPPGIGKATLAYRFARFLLLLADGEQAGGGPPPTLAVPPDAPGARRFAAGSHANLLAVDRHAPKPSRSRSEITIDAVREIGSFCRLTSGEGGWRAVVVDGAEDLNRNAENALLKILEEPPPRSVLLLVSHAPGRLLPTTRSRCRNLRLRPLGEAEVTAVFDLLGVDATAEDWALLSRLAAGSPGRALEIAEAGGVALHRRLVAALAGLAAGRFEEAFDFVQRVSGRDETYRVACILLSDTLRRLVRRKGLGEEVLGAGDAHAAAEENGEERAVVRSLLPRHDVGGWFAIREQVDALIAQGDRFNLDRQQVLHSALIRIADG
jgi:DNA polymerase III subunit delta'